MSIAIGWPEALAREIWEDDRLIKEMGDQRNHYRSHECKTSVSAILELMLETAVGDPAYPNDLSPSQIPGARCSVAEAKNTVLKKLEAGELVGEGIPADGGLPQVIPGSAWRNASLIPDGVGHDLVQPNGSVLFCDVWIKEARDQPSYNGTPKGKGGRKVSASWPDFVAAVSIWMVRQNDDATSIALIGPDVLLNAVSDVAAEWGVEFPRSTFQPAAQRLLDRMKEEAKK